MRYLILSLAVMLVSNCGPASPHSEQPQVYMPDSVTTHYEEFVRIIGTNRVTAGDIGFESDEYFSKLGSGHVIGVCQKTSDIHIPWTIRLKKSYWDKFPQFQRELLFHELTHCILNHMEHSTDSYSYMYPSQTHPLDLDLQVSEWL